MSTATAKRSSLKADSRKVLNGSIASRYMNPPKPIKTFVAVDTEDERDDKCSALERLLLICKDTLRAIQNTVRAIPAALVQRIFASLPVATNTEETSRKTSLYLEKMCEELIQNVTQVSNPNDLLSCCDHCHSTAKIPNCCNKKLQFLLDVLSGVSVDNMSERLRELFDEISVLEPLTDADEVEADFVEWNCSLVSTSQCFDNMHQVPGEIFNIEELPVGFASAPLEIQQLFSDSSSIPDTVFLQQLPLYLEDICELAIQNFPKHDTDQDDSRCTHCFSTAKIPNCCNKKLQFLLDVLSGVSVDNMSERLRELFDVISVLQPLADVGEFEALQQLFDSAANLPSLAFQPIATSSALVSHNLQELVAF
eukprot:TRINITY_DN4991_c0_g2_i1.p1 TRINITY_DN4991_c0_g2~~TRINITY_DN4991_c0_g2_i1.p1  ORF type:complete len:367 (+),score=80.85 TRINITY_DN4991_c0_g2_i1:146-1246(+)